MVDHSDAPAGSVSSLEKPPDGLQEFRVAPLVSSQPQKDANVQIEKEGIVPTVKFVGVVTRFDQAALPTEMRLIQQPEGNKSASRETPDAARVVTTRDGATIFFDAANRVSDVQYADGGWRSFIYDSNGQIAAIKDNGQSYFVEYGSLVTEYGALTEMQNPTVSADGTYSYNINGRSVRIYTDQTRQTTRQDGSTVTQDRNTFVTEIKYPDGRTRSFTYGGSSIMFDSFTDVDGKRYDYDPSAKSPGRTMRAADGSTITNLAVRSDGTVEYQNKDTTISVDYTNGNFSRTTRTAFDFTYAAFVLRPGNQANLDDSNIKNILEKMTPADRLALEAEYVRQHHRLLNEQLEADAKDVLKRVNAQAALRLLTEARMIETGKKP